MIKGKFHKPGNDGFTIDREIPAVPREGDTIQFKFGTPSYAGYRVHTVVWMPDEKDSDVYVVLR